MTNFARSGLRGQLVLDEGDAVFARDIGARGDPHEDILQMFVGTRFVPRDMEDSSLITDLCSDEDEDMVAKRAKLAQSRDAILGPRETRDGRRVWFEEQPRANPVAGATRCYGISNMYECQMNATGPPAALKVIEGQLDAVQLAVKSMVQVTGNTIVYLPLLIVSRSLELIIT